jgi:ribonuclease-3
MALDAERAAELHGLRERLEIPKTTLELLDRALTHSSILVDPHGPEHDYESLEFLGDAALGFAVAHELFNTYPDRTPGEYSRMRAKLVSRKTLSRIARRFDIAPYIRLGKGEEQSGGRQRNALLGDCLEAVIGAVYLSEGWEATQALCLRLLTDELREATDLEQVWDYKSRLQHLCQAERMALPRFDVITSAGPDHCKEFEVEVYLDERPMGRGRGRSKKEAEQEAARDALERVGVHFGQGAGRG